jgi:hypothetical protein
MLKVSSVDGGNDFVHLGGMYTAYRQASIAACTYRVGYLKRSKGVIRIQDKVKFLGLQSCKNDIDHSEIVDYIP